MSSNLGLNWAFYIIGFVLMISLTGNTSKTTTYTGLIFEQSQILPASLGVKSVLFNSARTKLYALNLEGMSIYEFDQADKKILREINFEPNKASGWDYALKKTMPSFAEKPVEACFSNQDKILWVSLHNSGGIVPIPLDSLLLIRHLASYSGKVIYITDIKNAVNDTIKVPLIKTGKTPKVIAKTIDNKYLLISNWSANTVSVLRINDSIPEYTKKIATIKLPNKPRGILVDNKTKKTYVAIMGGNTIKVINNKNWMIEKSLDVPRNPRHIIADSIGHLFVSFNSLSQIACINVKTGKILFKASTHTQPRTIALSKNQKFLFVTCYSGNMIDIFKISDKTFIKIYSLSCPGKPVGIDLYEDKNKIEAWVCNYMAGNLKVYTFRKKY